MNWISTNIRFPEDQYRRLKIKAAKERKSLAKIVREATQKNISEEKEIKKRKIKKVDKLWERRNLVARRLGSKLKDFDVVKALREMRYEGKW